MIFYLLDEVLHKFYIETDMIGFTPIFVSLSKVNPLPKSKFMRSNTVFNMQAVIKTK